MNTHPHEHTETFEPTFHGGRQERLWIQGALQDFHADDWITDVLYRVKGGKEATVYCCRAHPSTGVERIAAKIYRPRIFRAMRNDSLYKQGRGFLDADAKRVLKSRSLRALEKKSRYGRYLDTVSWIQHEIGTLRTLAEAGADVPAVLTAGTHAILMEYWGDEVQAAPILHGLALDESEARSVFDRLLRNVEIMLSRYIVHGDLSAYNVLYWEGEVCLIDFPQAVDAIEHPQGFDLFARDVDRLCRYFLRQGVAVDPYGLALDLWRRHVG